MKNKNTQKLTLAAMVAAAYAVLSLLGAVFGITYGPIQVRFSEALCLLPFLFPETAWGLGVGCLIACLVLGVLLVKQLPRIPYFRDRLQSR